MLCLYGFESAQNADLPCILKNLPTKSMSFFFQKRFFNANILNYIHKKNIPQSGYVEITFTTVVSEETFQNQNLFITSEFGFDLAYDL